MLLFFKSVCARPPQACKLGLQIHFSRFFNEVFLHLLQMFLGVGHHPEVVGPHETSKLLHFCFCFNLRKNSFSLLHPFFLHIGQYLGCHLLPQAWGFHASLSQASIESETAYAFKHGLSRQSQHLTQEGRNDPSVCIVTVHDLCHVLRPCFIEARLDIQARQVQCWPCHRPVFHHGILFLLPLPVFMYHIRHHHLQVLAAYPIQSTNMQILFQMQQDACMMRTTSTSPTSELLLCNF